MKVRLLIAIIALMSVSSCYVEVRDGHRYYHARRGWEHREKKHWHGWHLKHHEPKKHQ